MLDWFNYDNFDKIGQVFIESINYKYKDIAFCCSLVGTFELKTIN